MAVCSPTATSTPFILATSATCAMPVALGEQLVVALIGDGKTSYAFQQQERAEALSLLGIADALVLLEADEINTAIEALKPKVLVLGNEYKNNAEIQTTLDQQRQQGGTVQFHAGDIHYATADLLSGSERDLRQQRRSLFQAACRRQGIQQAQLLDAINSWESTRLIVLGDTIVDQYAACEAIGMSAEAPVVVVRELEHKNFIGGAAVVAAHISALGRNAISSPWWGPTARLSLCVRNWLFKASVMA